MKRLKKLVLEGFMSYREKQEVVFPRNGAILFSGRWLDKPISSGSGKSSLIHAVKFALGICDLPATTLKNWYSKKMMVSLTLEDDETGDLIEIIRDPKLQLIKNGLPYKGLASGAEEQLTEILQANPELVAALTDRRQREKGTFVNSTDSEIKTFLSTLLNMSSIENAGDQASKALADLVKELESQNHDIENQESTIKLMAVNETERESAEYAMVSAESRLKEFRDREVRVAQARVEIDDLTCQVNDAKNLTLAKINAIKAKQSDALKALDVEIALVRNQILLREREVRSVIDGYQKQIQDARAGIQTEVRAKTGIVESEERGVRSQISALQDKIGAARLEAQTRVSDIQTQIDSIRKTETLITLKGARNDVIKKRLFELKSEIDKIKACLCYTCNQKWVTGDCTIRETEAKALLVELQENSAAIKSATTLVAALSDVQLQMVVARIQVNDPLPEATLAIAQLQSQAVCPELKSQIADLQRKSLDPLPEISEIVRRLGSEIVAPDLRASVSALEAKRRTSDPQTDAEIRFLMTQLSDPLPEAMDRIQKLQQGIAAVTAARSDAESALRSAQELHSSVIKRIAACNIEISKLGIKKGQRDQIAQKVETEKHVAAILGRNGFLSAIFDEVLAEIQTNTNEMLLRLSNTSDITMELTSSKETKAGAIQKKTSLKFFKNGMPVPSIKGLSGGQQCGIELFADIAVAKCIRRRRGCHLGWMMLDEALDGLDAATLKREALEIIKSQIDGQVFIIDHSTEVKEGFELTVQVIYNGRDSYVQTAT